MRLTPLVTLAILLLPYMASAHSGVPSYLFVDWRYWLFLLLYVLLTVRLVTWVRRAADLRDAQKPFPLRDVSWAAALILCLGLIYEGVHHYEHVSQIYQFAYLGQHKTVSKGVLLFFDIELSHFLFAVSYFAILASGIYLLAKRWTQRGHRMDDTMLGFIILTLGFQSWHLIEHTYRFVKHVDTGCNPCVGIADAVFDIPQIPLHFFFNTVTFTFPLLLFFWMRMDRLVLAFLHELGTRLRMLLRPPEIDPHQSSASTK